MGSGVRKRCWVVLGIMLVIGVGTSVLATGAGDQPVSEIETLRVGALFPQSGPMAHGAARAIEGVQIAVDLFNELNEYGITVELVTADAPDPAGGTSGVRHLITQRNVDVVIGTYSSAVASAAAPAAERLRTFYVETTAFAEGVTRDTENVIRTTINSGALGAAAIDFIVGDLADELGVDESEMRIAAVFTDDEFGTSIMDGARQALAATNARLVVDESYSAATVTDLSSVLLRIQEQRPHAVMHIAQVPDGILFWRQAQELNVNMPAVVGAGGGYGQIEFAEGLGANVNGIFNVVPPTSGAINVDALSESAQDLLRRLQDALAERDWIQGDYTDWAFMGSWVFLNEVVPRAASTSIEDLMEAASHVRVDALDSITGFGFEFAGRDHENFGQNLRAMPVVQQWQDGRQLVVSPAELAVAEFINVPLPAWDER